MIRKPAGPAGQGAGGRGRRPLAAATFLALGVSAMAGDARAQSSEWEYSLSVYGWFTGMTSKLETRFGDVEADVPFRDILENLDIAAFAAFEARNGRWALLTDLNYAALSARNDTPAGIAFSDVEVDAKLTVVSAFAAYAVVDRPDLRIDLAGGLRYYDIDIDVALNAAAAANDRSAAFGDGWVDPLVGARMRAHVSDAWFVDGFADLGGFGVGGASNLSWQVYGGVGYALNETWTLRGGYRYLSIDKDVNGRGVSLGMYGPVIGVTARF